VHKSSFYTIKKGAKLTHGLKDHKSLCPLAISIIPILLLTIFSKEQLFHRGWLFNLIQLKACLLACLLAWQIINQIHDKHPIFLYL